MECYAPVQIAERCFLSEAILWILVQEVPTVEEGSGAASDDPRFSDDRVGEGGNIVDLDALSPADCEKIGISPNPAPQLDDYGSECVTFATLRLLDEDEGKDSNISDLILSEHSKEEIQDARKLEELHSQWIETVDSAMELPKLQILQAILKRDLPAFCRNEIQHEVNNDEDHDETGVANDENFIDADNPSIFVEAPPGIFKAKSIDWQLSCSTIGKLWFVDICVDTIALLRLFPDTNEHSITVSKVGNVLISRDRDTVPQNRPRRGRPPLPWAEMHQELGRRIERGDIPDKKEALVAELIDWCRVHWNRDVSRSAIQSQLSYFGNAKKPQT